MSERNRELFEKIAAHIEETPYRYDQDTWFDVTGAAIEDVDLCSTTMCIAGWAVFLTEGLEWFYGNDGQERYFEGEISDHAANLLGLDLEESDVIFDSGWMDNAEVGEVADALRSIGNGRPIMEQS